MRIYKIELEKDIVVIHADEIQFKNDFWHETLTTPLVLFRENRLLAIFKKWNSLIDLGEYLPLQSIES